jgi:predicted deacetylase
MSSHGKIVIAIHDVSPVHGDQVRYLLDACTAIGARPLVLKVIPNEAGSNDIRQYSEFAGMLAREASAGSEIVLHGYTHQIARPISGLGLQQMRGRLFAGNVAEFLTLDRRAMGERLRAGLQILREVGLDPHGFCAPGWLAASYLPRQLRDCGLTYYTTMAAVHGVLHDQRVWTPWTGYMGADPVQERLVRLGGDVWTTLARRAPVLKVFLHPQRARESADCSHILQQIPKLIENRRIMTYGALIAQRS